MDRSTQKKEHFKLGDKVDGPGRRAAQGLHARRLHAGRRGRLVRRRGRDRADPARGAADARQDGLRHGSRSPPSRASRQTQLAQSLRAELPLTVNVRTGEQASRSSRRTSRATSASCARSCSSSASSRCSSARSSSSTRSRSPSRSARASSGCCARSAPRAARCCARRSARALLLGVLGSAARHRCSGSRWRRGSRRCSAAIGVDLPSNGPRHRAADDHRRRWSSARRGASLGARAGAARDARRPDGGAARVGRSDARPRLAPADARSPTSCCVIGVALIALGLFGGGSTNRR